MAVYIRTHKPLDTSLRIWATPPPDLTLRLSTLKTICNCKTYQTPKTLILPQCPIMFVWVLSIDPPVSDRATWNLPLMLISTTLKLSILETLPRLESFQPLKQSISRSSTIVPFQVVMSRTKQRKIPPASQHVQTDVSWSAPTL